MWTFAGIIAALGGALALMRFLGVLSIFGPVIGAFLAPFADLMARAITGAIRSIAAGLRIVITNITAFWVLIPLVFISGAVLLGYIDPFKAKAAKIELKEVHRENAEYRKKLNLPPRKSKVLKASKTSTGDHRGEVSKDFRNPFSFSLNSR